MARTMQSPDSRLFLNTLQSPDTEPGLLKSRLADMERMFNAAQEEISLLSGERDELVAAIKQWAKADRLERQELLMDAITQDIRSELKVLRGKVKRLERENNALRAPAVDQGLRRLRA